MAAQLLAFAVNMGISFLLAPIIEAKMENTYGFVTLANQFVLYAQIVVSALNTMASRFITIHIHRGEDQTASEYFSSVFFGNVMMAGIFLLPALVIVIFMGSMPFLNVPADVLHDVQLLWAFVFANFFLSIITSVYGISTYATNRLDLTSIRTMYGDIIRIVFLFGTFLIFKPTLWFIGAASLLSTAYTAFWNRRFTRAASAPGADEDIQFPLEKGVGAGVSGSLEFPDPSGTAAAGWCGYSAVRRTDSGWKCFYDHAVPGKNGADSDFQSYGNGGRRVQSTDHHCLCRG